MESYPSRILWNRITRSIKTHNQQTRIFSLVQWVQHQPEGPGTAEGLDPEASLLRDGGGAGAQQHLGGGARKRFQSRISQGKILKDNREHNVHKSAAIE